MEPQTLPANATADFINGLIYGMTGDTSISPEQLEECYTALKPDVLSLDLQVGIKSLEKGILITDIVSNAGFLAFIK